MNQRYRPISRLGLGGTGLGDMYHTTGDEAARTTVDAAWDAGIRYFDTAPHYGTGLSEHRFGQALRTRPRHDYTLSTKVGRVLVPDPAGDIAPPFVSSLPFRRLTDCSAWPWGASTSSTCTTSRPTTWGSNSIIITGSRPAAAAPSKSWCGCAKRG